MVINCSTSCVVAVARHCPWRGVLAVRMASYCVARAGLEHARREVPRQLVEAPRRDADVQQDLASRLYVCSLRSTVRARPGRAPGTSTGLPRFLLQHGHLFLCS